VRLAGVSLLAFLILGAAAARAARSPIAMTERGASVLVWLETHPKPGTRRSRARLAAISKARIWGGLWLAGVAWRDRRTGDVSPSSPFGCIHGHEAGWHGDANPTYDGGLQMDRGFQGTYGAIFGRLWGPADRWPIWAQLVTAYRAQRIRGYGPWPTRRYCGL